jgi:hypothetical protein
MYELFRAGLCARGFDYADVHGSWTQRRARALAETQALLAGSPEPAAC